MDDFGLLERGQDAHPAVAARALENVGAEYAAHECFTGKEVQIQQNFSLSDPRLDPKRALELNILWSTVKQGCGSIRDPLGGGGLRSVEELDVALGGLVLRVAEQTLEYGGRRRSGPLWISLRHRKTSLGGLDKAELGLVGARVYLSFCSCALDMSPA